MRYEKRTSGGKVSWTIEAGEGGIQVSEGGPDAGKPWPDMWRRGMFDPQKEPVAAIGTRFWKNGTGKVFDDEGNPVVPMLDDGEWVLIPLVEFARIHEERVHEGPLLWRARV